MKFTDKLGLSDTPVATPHSQLDPIRDAIPPDDTTAPQQIIFYLRRLCIIAIDIQSDIRRLREFLERHP